MTNRHPSAAHAAVPDAMIAIQLIYSALTAAQQRDLDDRLLDAEWFGKHIRMRCFFRAAQMVLDHHRWKNASRCRPKSGSVEERNGRIREARARGLSLRQLAGENGLSVAMIRKILAS